MVSCTAADEGQDQLSHSGHLWAVLLLAQGANVEGIFPSIVRPHDRQRGALSPLLSCPPGRFTSTKSVISTELPGQGAGPAFPSAVTNKGQCQFFLLGS